MSEIFNSRKPYYNDDSDYTTNTPSYYDDLARKQKLLELLSKRIWEYDKTLADSLENIKNVLGDYIDIVDGKIALIDHKIGEGFNQEINDLLVQWLEDGTLDHIINVTLMNKKADITYVDNIVTGINKFGEFGTVNDNVNFIKACETVSLLNETLLIRNMVINLNDVVIDNLPNIISINSTINISGKCIFNRSFNGFSLDGLNIVTITPTTERLFNIINVDDVSISNVSFTYVTGEAVRSSTVFYFSNTTNIEMNDIECIGVNFPITIQDKGDIAVSKNIKFRNITFKNCKGGFWITAANIPYGQSGFIKDLEFFNCKGINTFKEGTTYTAALQGASMFLFEHVKDAFINETYCESPVERIGYFNVTENIVIENTVGVNTEGIKFAGLLEKRSKNFLIDGLYIKNSLRASYIFRGYFCEDGVILNAHIDNSKMIIKPSEVFSLSCYVKNLKINGFSVDGSSAGIFISRIEEFTNSNVYAFYTSTPVFENIEFINGDVKNIALTNNSSLIMDMRFNLDSKNPALIANPNLLDDKEIFKNFVMDNVRFKINNNYAGKVGNFRNTVNPLINIEIKGYNNLYATKIIAFNDVVSRESLKKININIDGNGSLTDIHLNTLIGLLDNCSIKINYTGGNVYLITSNKDGKIKGVVTINERNLNVGQSLFFIRTNNTERYIVKYQDEIDEGSFMVSGNGVVTPYRTSETFSTTVMHGNIMAYYLNDYTRITNNTENDRRSASGTILVELL